MGITIYDLAREAGVGIGTVSRCLNNHPSVAAHTRAKVLAAAKRMSYQPHAHAQRLASRRTNTISAIIPYFTNYFFLQVLQGVQDRASELGFDLILYGVNNPSDVEYYLRRSLQRGRVDGVLFFSMKFPESYASKFPQMNLPLVLVDTFHPAFDSLRVKNREGARLATEHLIRLGHRRIAMLNASLNTLPSVERLEGYRDAMAAAGLPSATDLEFSSAIGGQDGFNRQSGRESMRSLLEKVRGGHSCTAAFVASDIQALGALEIAREQGVAVPGDLALIGFDDIELAEHADLTTMRQPLSEMGRLSMDRLVARLQGASLPPMLKEFTPELVVRRSSGALPLPGGKSTDRAGSRPTMIAAS